MECSRKQRWFDSAQVDGQGAVMAPSEHVRAVGIACHGLMIDWQASREGEGTRNKTVFACAAMHTQSCMHASARMSMALWLPLNVPGRRAGQ